MDINRKEFLMLALGLGVGSTAGCFVQTPPPNQPTGAGGPEPGPSDEEVVEPAEEGMFPANECVDWDATGECVAWEGYKPTDEGMGMPADECVNWDPSGECIGWAGDAPVAECVDWSPSGECIAWDSPVTE